MKTLAFVGLALAVTFSVGCRSTKPIDKHTVITVHEGTGDKPPETTTVEAILGKIVAQETTIRVIDNSTDAGTGTKIKRAVEGAIVAAGLKVSDGEKPYATVTLNSSMKQFDKMGNYYVHRATTEVTIKRHDKKLLGRETLTAKGKRKLGEAASKQAAAATLIPDVQAVVKKQALGPAAKLGTAMVRLQFSGWKRLFESDNNFQERLMQKFSKQVASTPGVVSCQLARRDTDSAYYMIVYQKDKFNRGIVMGDVKTTIMPDQTDDPITDFVNAILRR